MLYMRFKRMNKKAAVTVKLPSLNGGVNLYDIPTEAADNQLTACENVWWYKGALRTRPGYRKPSAAISYPASGRQVVNEREMLCTELFPRGALEGNYLKAYHVDVAEGTKTIGLGGSDVVYGDSDQTVLGFRVPTAGNNEWFFLLSGGTILQGSTDNRDGLNTMEPYIPTVLINGYGDEGRTDYSEPSGDVYQDYNMLTRVYKATYTTDGVSTRFCLLDADFGDDRTDNDNGWICGHIKIIMADGSTVESDIYTVDEHGDRYAHIDLGGITGAQVGDSSYTDIQMTGNLDLNTKMVEIEFSAKVPVGDGETMEEYHLPLPKICSNNIEITAYRDREYDEERETICKMTRCTWYGGSRSGLSGGSRLFVCGNPDEPNLLHWSGIEHPLYFPEHNYARVGNANEAITAFGKQGELLILFKEHQMYAAQYVAGEEDDYDFAQEGGVPITTYAATFPVTPLHDSIGCDCPDTVRMVNNRLVWVNSSGHVYMLTATNQFSERNVRDISRNIAEDMAAQGEALKTAVSGEYEGYYMLAVGQRVYLLDTQNSAFASFNYYSSEDTARKALPWYIWQMPFTIDGMVSDGTRILMTAPLSAATYELGGDTDGENPIAAHFATKMFDFGMQDRTKSVGQIYIGAHVVPEGSVALTYLSEKGNRRDPYEIDGGELAALGSEGGLRSTRLTPYMNLIQTFGIRVDATAAMAVDGITIKVRQQGVVR